MKFIERLRKFDFFALGPAAIIWSALELLVLPFFAGKQIGYPAWITAALALAFAAFGYGLTGNFKEHIRKLRNPWRAGVVEKRAWLVFWVLFGIGLLDKILRLLSGGYFLANVSAGFSASPFYSLIGMIDWLPYVAIALAASMALRAASPDRRFRYALWLSLGVEIAYALPSCSRARVILPIVIWLVIEWYRGKRRWLKICIFLLLLPILMAWGNVCRNPVFGPGFVALQKPGLLWQSSIARLDQSTIFTALLKNGKNIAAPNMMEQVLISLGPPRILWPQKPAISAGGNEFGRAIGLLDPNDRVTSIDPTLPGDWYWHFGLWGLFLGMFMMGILWRFIYEYWMGGGVNTLALSAYAVIWAQVVRGMENTFVPVYAGLARLLVILFVLALFLHTKSSDKT